MTQLKEGAEPERLTLRLSGEAAQAVRQIARDRSLSVNEVIRRAIGTELFFTEAQAKGERILLEDSDKRFREIVLR